MVFKEFPQGKKIKQLKRVNYFSYWRKITFVLAFLFLFFFSWKILVGLSEPSLEEERVNIQSANEADQVSGMTAYQYDFREGGQNINKPYIGLNVQGASSAEVGGTGLNLGAAADGDVQLPFNLFFPGRGQEDTSSPQRPYHKLLGMEIDPRTNNVVWKFNNSSNGGIPSTIVGDAANVPSIQRINKQMLDLIFTADEGYVGDQSNDGFNGIVFGNDVSPPQIVVARFRYKGGTAVIPGPFLYNGELRYNYKIFYINSAPYSFTTDNRVHFYGELNPADRRGSLPPVNYTGQYPGGIGFLHDVHLVRKNTQEVSTGYSFIVTIVNAGVLELTPIDNRGNLRLLWNYMMPTFCKEWSIGESSEQGKWEYKEEPVLKWHTERSTTWYAQPIDNNNDGIWNNNEDILISVGPHQSYKDAGTGEGTCPYLYQRFELGGNIYNNPNPSFPPSERGLTGCDDAKYQYPCTNNYGDDGEKDRGCEKTWSPTEVRRVNRGQQNPNPYNPNDSSLRGRYFPKLAEQREVGGHDDDWINPQPKVMGNIVPTFLGNNNNVYANNSHFFIAGYVKPKADGSCCEINWDMFVRGNVECQNQLDQFTYTDSSGGSHSPMDGPRIFEFYSPVMGGTGDQTCRPTGYNYWDSYYYRFDPREDLYNKAYGDDPYDLRSNIGYSETAFQLPNPDLFFVNWHNYQANTYDVKDRPNYMGKPAVIRILKDTGIQHDRYVKPVWQWNQYAYVHMGAGTYTAYGTKRPENWDSDIVGKYLDAITDMRDGGLASQLAPPPHDSYVRDFESMRTVGLDSKNNTNLFGQSKLAYALADEEGKFFRGPRQDNNLNQESNQNIDLRDMVREDGEGWVNKNLEKYQQIWLTALMWGDVGSGLNQFQRSNTPVLQAWGISYKDKTAKFRPTLTATTGKDPDPRNYTSDGGSQFYTGKEHNQVRYKLTVTNDNGDITWPANNIQVKINPDSSKESLNANQVYYRVIKKSAPQGQKLKVRASKNCCCHNASNYPQHCPNPDLEMRVYVNGTYVDKATVNSESFKNYEFNVYPTTEDEIKVEFPIDNGDLIIQSIAVNNSDKTGTVTIPWNSQGVKYFPCGNDWWYFNPYECKDICDKIGRTRCWGGCSCDGGVSSGGVMAWRGYVLFPRFISREWIKIDPGNIINNTIIIPDSITLEKGDVLEVIYTTTIQKAGKINHSDYLQFKNKGNNQFSRIPVPQDPNTWDQSTIAFCTGNAPWVQTLYGDVYMGGCPEGSQCFPYQAYGNATFLIQSNGSIAPYFSSQKGWLQPNYPLADELKLNKEKGVVAKIKRNIEAAKARGELEKWGGGANIINSLNNQSSDKKGYYYQGNLTISGGNLYKNKGAKLIVVDGNLIITGDTGGIKYEGGSDPTNVEDLACLGIVVFGDLNISSSVSRLDGVYFVTGTINTCVSATPSACDNQLVSYGLWVAKEFLLNRTYAGGENDPAEKIIYDGRIALNPPVGLSDFGQLFPVWKEVAP